jgi:hypothetical protein
MKLLKQATALALLLCCGSAFCQNNFETGYTTDNNGAKKAALIKNEGWKNNPETFEFQGITDTNENGTGTLANYSGFGVSGYIFERHTVSIDRSPTALAYLDEQPEPLLKRETRFLKLLVSGEISLYKYEDSEMPRFFYKSATDSEPQQLIYKSYRENNKILYNKTYKSVLQQLFKAKITNAETFKNLEYREKELVKLFREYNGVAADAEQSADKRKSTIHLRATAGVNVVSLTMNYDKVAEAPYDFDTKAVAVVGAEFEWILPFNNNKWALTLSPSFQSYKATGEKVFGQGSSAIFNRWAVDYKAIDVAAGARHYLYLNDNARISLSAAYVYSNPLGDSGVTFSKGNTQQSSLAVKADSKGSSSYQFGVGFSYKKYSAEARYYGKRGITSGYANWRGEYSGVGLQLGYLIF